MKTFFAFLFGFLVAIILPLVVAWGGWINLAANDGAGPVESVVAPWVYERSLKHHAPDTTNPVASDPQAIAAGLDHFRESCLLCHGAPEVERRGFAEYMAPHPPELSEEGEKLSDGELYWIIKYGARMTGMPAFGAHHSDEEIWNIVAFVRHLPELTPAEREQLRAATKDEGATGEGAGHAH